MKCAITPKRLLHSLTYFGLLPRYANISATCLDILVAVGSMKDVRSTIIQTCS